MQRSILLVTVLGFCFLGSTVCFAAGARFTPEEKRIIELQDKRTGVTEITTHLSSSNEKIAWRAAVALGNIGDASAKEPLRIALEKEKRPSVIDGIALALGLLGPDIDSYEALTRKSTALSSGEIWIALGRTVPKEKVNDLISRTTDTYNSRKKGDALSVQTNAYATSSLLVELGLRKLMTDEAASLIREFENEPDPTSRWRAIYSLVRLTDTALLGRHIETIKSYLNDAGSPECRMFAATALGALHDQEALRLLVTAARSETEWRVRVNIFNAFARQQYFTSGMFDVLKKAVLESNPDTLATIHVAITALEVLDRMIDAGKVSSPDSVTLKTWLKGFDAYNSLHDDLPITVRAAAIVPAARFGPDCIIPVNVGGYYSFRNRVTEIYTDRALGSYPDTVGMFALLFKVIKGDPNLISILDGLHRQWLRATKDTAYWNLLARHYYLEPYRHLMIRLPDRFDRIDVVGPAMEYLSEPNVALDSFRTEAETYLIKYLDKFDAMQYADQQISVLGAVRSLKLNSPPFQQKVAEIYKHAVEWRNYHLANQAYMTLDSIGVKNVAKINVEIVRDSIDWQSLETCPDTLLVSTKYGFLFVKPLPYDAPLSVLNILKLARIQYFSTNYIHRLVPNFVVQTGDPTGSGWGGPGYVIRTEISPAQYDMEGICGMASDGKDTEGSQWFITHSPTPHLNTRYTIWGKVVKNIENLEKIQFQDMIENMLPYK